MAADKHERELLVGHFFGKAIVVCAARERELLDILFERCLVFAFVEAQLVFAFYEIERPIAGHAHQPCLGIVRRALVRPKLQRLQHGELHRVFDHVQPVGAEEAGEPGSHAPELAAKQMVHQLVDRFRVSSHRGSPS
jgi:hypothetical protein